MPFTLKTYQQRVLTRLEEFFNLVHLQGVAAAYAQVAHRADDNGKRENPYAAQTYRPLVENLPCPHVCLRVPTGGGKTYLAARALPIAARFVERQAPTVLWITPTDAIRRQTVAMLKNRDHPCRQVLEEAFGNDALVHDADDFDGINAQDITQRACVVVSTAAKFRVEETQSRRVYDTNEHFQPHFKRLLPNPPPAALEHDDKGKVKHSFVNLLHLLRPVVVLDEAHNFVSDLSKEVLRRINPSCVVEWTATPRENGGGNLHNVLASVTAEELQREEMVKLPIMVTEHDGWEHAVGAAVAERERLAKTAAASGDGVRPLVLYQAQNKNDSVPPQTLKDYLIQTEGVAAEKIAVATAEVKDLDGVDLMAADCPIEHVITVQALREGWDCANAYVLCSIPRVRSATAIEQLMGRVMRMPQARRRANKDLNCAYAHVIKDNINNAVELMREKLAVKLGFEESEAKESVLPFQQEELIPPSAAKEATITFATTAMPDFSALPPESREIIAQAVEVKPPPQRGGAYQVVIKNQPLPSAAQQAIIAVVPTKERTTEEMRLATFSARVARAQSPADRGVAFAPLPQLLFYSPEEGKMVTANDDELYLVANWNDLPDNRLLESFTIQETADTFSISTKSGKVKLEHVGDYHFPLLGNDGDDKTRPQLVGWLEREIRDSRGRYYPETLKTLINANVDKQLNDGCSLKVLHRAKYQFAHALKDWFRKHEDAVSNRTAQQFLFDDGKVRCDFSFRFPSVVRHDMGDGKYAGAYVFQKHFHGDIAAMDNKEEEECARLLDRSPQVKHWFRNPERKSFSYVLPLNAKRNFYPDFVAELNNGKLLVVEYKGEHLYDNNDSRQKRNIGAKMEELAAGRCFFLMAGKRSGAPSLEQQLHDKIAAATA